MKNRFKKILLKICSVLTVLGAFIVILAIPSKAAEIPLSLLDIANMKQVTFYYYSTNENNDYSRVHYTMVKDGVFGYEEDYTWTLNLSAFATDSALTQVMVDNIYSPYGLFFHTNYSIYEFIFREGSYPHIIEDYESFLEYEFIVPVTLQDVYFENQSFTAVEFLNSENVTLGYLEGNAPVNISNVSKIRCISSDSAYYDEPYYLASGVSSASYSQGYVDGRNSANNIINNLQSENNTLQNVNESLQAEISSLQSQLQNVNGSWQSVFFTMVDIPFLTMSNVLNFDLFGLNLYRALIGMLTILAIFFLFRKLSGK